ncbi:MAG: rcc01693 family protein [Pseudomonadota bacterium]
MSEATDTLAWAQLMRLGLGTLRLAPEHFWAMTPVELLCALEGAGVLAPEGARLGRTRLDALMHRYPDAPAYTKEPPHG